MFRLHIQKLVFSHVENFILGWFSIKFSYEIHVSVLKARKIVDLLLKRCWNDFGLNLLDTGEKLRNVLDIWTGGSRVSMRGWSWEARTRGFKSHAGPFFSRRVSSEKCPTITMASFFLFFVRQQTSPCMYLFLVQTWIDLRGTQRSRAPVTVLARKFFEHLRKRTRLKGQLFQFFGSVRLFFWNFFAFERVPLNFLDNLQQTEFSKSPKENLLHFLERWDFFKILIFRLKLGSQYIPASLFFNSIQNRRNILSKEL